MLDGIVAASLEDVHEPDDVRVDVGVRVLQGVANAGLGGEVHDAVEPLAREERRDGRAVGDVEVLEPETFVRTQSREPSFLERHVVVVAQRIEPDNGIPTLEQP
jgi:hypothetical protein